MLLVRAADYGYESRPMNDIASEKGPTRRDAMAADKAIAAEAAAETLSLARNWLLADPELAYSRAKRDAARMKIRLTPRMFSEARRSLGITGGPPRPTPKKAAPAPEQNPMNDKEKAPTPMTAFVTEYLRTHPDAEYAALKSAAAQKGFKIAPIVFGRARKGLGLAPMAKKGPGRPKAEPRPATRAAAAGTRRGASGSAFTGDLGGVLGRLQEMASDRDRFHSALEEIARIIRSVI